MNRSKAFALAAAGVLAFGIAGCGGDETTETTIEVVPGQTLDIGGPDPYAAYMDTAQKTKGAMTDISAEAAEIRAQQLCGNPSVIAAPLKTLPTEYRLFQAYCPAQVRVCNQ